MKAKAIEQLKMEVDAVISGRIAPARVYTLVPDGKGGFTRQELDPEEYRQRQTAQAAAPNETAAARARLKLSQSQFAKLLGVSVDTLQNWEQGRRQPRGAAKVLLRIATDNPAAVLAATES